VGHDKSDGYIRHKCPLRRKYNTPSDLTLMSAMSRQRKSEGASVTKLDKRSSVETWQTKMLNIWMD
jgi:hypothetical protein